MAPLKKRQIIEELSKYGINISSVQKLNKLLTEMGIIKYVAGFWTTTNKGLKYSIYSTTQVLNGDLWHDTIVEAIVNYMKNK